MEPSGRTLAGRDYDPVEGRVIVEDGETIAVEQRPTESTDIVRPAFVDAHVHVGGAAKEAGAPFAVHVAEADAHDIDQAMDLGPDHLVHTVHAEQMHLERVADGGTPVAVCPRSNLVTDAGLPPVEALLERTTVALGTTSC